MSSRYQKKDLKSNRSFDYVFISLFMFTYRTTSPRTFNKIITDKIASLKSLCNLPPTNLKTITQFRNELTQLFVEEYFPDRNFTNNDLPDLFDLFVSISAMYDLSLPTDFIEAVKSNQERIATDLLNLNQPVISFFSSLHHQEDSLFTYDRSFILLLIFDLIAQHYFTKYQAVFVTIKEKILSEFFSNKFNIASFTQQPIPDQTPSTTTESPIPDPTTNHYIPGKILDLVDSHTSFLIIYDNYEFLEFGNASHLKPTFELTLRKLFLDKGITYPPQWFQEMILNLIKIPLIFGSDKEKKKEIISLYRNIITSYTSKINYSQTNTQHVPVTTS